MKHLLLALMVACAAQMATAAVLYIDGSPGKAYAKGKDWPEDKTYATVADALQAQTSATGHTLYIAPGTYHIDAQLYANTCSFIGDDPSNPQSVLLVGAGEEIEVENLRVPSCWFRNLTLTNFWRKIDRTTSEVDSLWAIAGIKDSDVTTPGSNYSPTFSNSVITACQLPILSRGVYHCIVRNCEGGLFFTATAPAYHSLFINNRITYFINNGNNSPCSGPFNNCTFVDNTNDVGTVAFAAGGSNVRNSIFHGNMPYDIAGNGSYEVLKRCLYGTVDNPNNISSTKVIDCIQADTPKFNLGANPDLPYYALKKSSSALNRGDESLNLQKNDDRNGTLLPLLFPTDLAGNPRINTEDGVSKLDLGCYEWYPTKGGLYIIFR